MTGTIIEIQADEMDCILIEVTITEYSKTYGKAGGDPCTWGGGDLEYEVATLTFDEVAEKLRVWGADEPLTQEDYQTYLDQVKRIELGYCEDEIWQALEKLQD